MKQITVNHEWFSVLKEVLLQKEKDNIEQAKKDLHKCLL